MRYSLIFSLFAASLLLLSGCVEERCVTGSGNVVSESRRVDGFSGIELSVPGDLYLTQGSSQSLKIEAEDNIVPLLETKVVYDRLIIDVGECITPKRSIKIYVTMEEVERLEISGSGDIIIDSEIDARDLDLLISGSGNIICKDIIDADAISARISGSGDMDLLVDCEDLSTVVEGSGNFELDGVAESHTTAIDGSGGIESFDLSTKRSQITVSGSGSAEISVSEELDVNIDGSGDVYYKGNPEKTSIEISGSGHLRNVD